ncbi:hypothetical protein M1116_02315 [Patescibacteria group bacterium]|nr:hypothetical protein [Patescibacteria group bacterium]
MKKLTTGSATVTLIIFIAIASIITTAAITTIAVNSLAASRFEEGNVASFVAESGIEEGLIRFLRDPLNYTGETLTTSDGQAQITVSADKTTLTSTGTAGNYVRTIQVQLNYSDNLTLSSWHEIY